MVIVINIITFIKEHQATIGFPQAFLIPCWMDNFLILSPVQMGKFFCFSLATH